MCNNTIELLPNLYTVYPFYRLSADPTYYQQVECWNWRLFWDIVVTCVTAVISILTGLGASGGNWIFGIIVGFITFSLLNNEINAIYYANSSGVSSLNNESYSMEKDQPIERRYLTRWDRLDYAKQQTGDSVYFGNAHRYYAEYSLHMYGWLVVAGAYIDDSQDQGLPSTAKSLREAEVDAYDWDGRWYVDLATIIMGMLGI